MQLSVSTRGHDRLPPFQPHWWLKGPHAQTIAAVYLPGSRRPYRAQRHEVAVEGGDRIVLHDDCPGNWRSNQRAVLLVHGLAGCHLSNYMVRIAARLNERGLRTFRMDLRGCGAGLGLARRPFHAGRSEDVAAAVQFIVRLCPDSPTTLVGFSLGGNLVLKLLGENTSLPDNLDTAIAVCPPIDLHACSQRLDHPTNRFYSNHLLSVLTKNHQRRRQLVADAVEMPLRRRPSSMRELDDVFVAPIWGFQGAEDYYRHASARRVIQRVMIPTHILASQDDPLVPVGQFDSVDLPPPVQLHVTQHGGHLGFVGRSGRDPDRRWMDWRVVDWVVDGR